MTTDRDAFNAELADILRVPVGELPRVFTAKQVKILKIGVDVDIRTRFPDADPERLASWLQRYTTSLIYLKRTVHKRARNRHDLDGIDVEPIASGARYRAFRMLEELGKQKQAA